VDQIIVVSYEEDKHAQELIKRAHEKNVHAVLWDISQYPDSVELTLLPGSDEVSVRVGGALLDNLTGIYWRRPNGKYCQDNTDKLTEYMRSEGRVVTHALAEYLPCINWLSKPWIERSAGNKPLQLKIAEKLGLRIPYTCISNSPDDVRRFVESLGGRKLTMKPVGTSFIDLDEHGDLSSDENKVVFTKLIDPTDVIENLQMVKNCPVIFQEAIEKNYDLRVTVVDDVIFTAKIVLEGCEDRTNLDWRNYEGERIYTSYQLPEKVAEQCVSIVHHLGLRFGCVDIGVSREGEYVFFEVNPQGQWLPSEDKLGYNISGTIVSALTK